MPSIRENILAALATQLSASRETLPESNADLPSVHLIDEEETIQKIEYGSNTVALRIRVQKLDNYTGDRSTYANGLLSDIISGTTGSDRTLGGLCDGIDYVSGVTVYPESESSVVAAVAFFDVNYRFDVGDPTTNSF